VAILDSPTKSRLRDLLFSAAPEFVRLRQRDGIMAPRERVLTDAVGEGVMGDYSLSLPGGVGA
jgi:hypothetical protein